MWRRLRAGVVAGKQGAIGETRWRIMGTGSRAPSARRRDPCPSGTQDRNRPPVAGGVAGMWVRQRVRDVACAGAATWVAVHFSWDAATGVAASKCAHCSHARDAQQHAVRRCVQPAVSRGSRRDGAYPAASSPAGWDRYRPMETGLPSRLGGVQVRAPQRKRPPCGGRLQHRCNGVTARGARGGGRSRSTTSCADGSPWE